MIYEKNLKALTQKNPVLAAKLLSTKENLRFEVFIDKNDSASINLYDHEKEVPLFEGKPMEEVQVSYNDIFNKYKRYPFLFFFGIGNGVLLKLILEMQQIQQVIVVEPNVEMIYIVLNLIDFSEEILADNIRFLLAEDTNFNTLIKVCNHADIKPFLKVYELQVNGQYYFNHYSETIVSINKLFTQVIMNVILSIGNDANDSITGLKHHVQNLPFMLSTPTFHSLVKGIKEKNAVIVSTGPSLSKQIPLLKAYQEYLTILCLDASLPILQKEGIAPDVVFSIERVALSAKFYENLDKELLKDTVFCITSVVHEDMIENLKGMKVQMNMRPFGYTRSFELHEWGYVGLGMSAANMAFEFAYIVGFENVLIIGQDLSFGDDGTSHAKNAVYGESEISQKETDFYVPGYYGGEVRTTKVWSLFLDYFKKDIPTALEKGMNIYNCTEGGAFITGAAHEPFKEVLEKVALEKKKEIELTPVDEKFAADALRQAEKVADIYYEEAINAKEKTEKVFLQLMELLEELEEYTKKEILDTFDFDKINPVLDAIDEVKDLYGSETFVLYFHNITNSFIVNQELELARIMVRNTETEIEKNVKIIDWLYEHKSWLFFLAGALDSIAVVVKEGKSFWKKEEDKD